MYKPQMRMNAAPPVRVDPCKMLVHPGPPAYCNEGNEGNEAPTPRKIKLDQAIKVIADLEQANRQGRGSGAANGSLVDQMHAVAAHRTVAPVGAIEKIHTANA